MFTHDDMLAILRHRCAEAGGQKPFAMSIGYSPQYLSDILQGRKDVSRNLARQLGFERKIVFYTCKTQNGGAKDLGGNEV